jgi:hypothetical protein
MITKLNADDPRARHWLELRHLLLKVLFISSPPTSNVPSPSTSVRINYSYPIKIAGNPLLGWLRPVWLHPKIVAKLWPPNWCPALAFKMRRMPMQAEFWHPTKLWSNLGALCQS